MRLGFGLVAGVLALACAGSAADAADYAGPYRHHAYRGHNFRGYIGACVRTRVAEIGATANAPLIRYADGVVQEYDPGMLGHVETRPGDPIQLCLVSFTRECGMFSDERPGRTYATGNLRTGAAWTLPDARSSCASR